MANEPSGPPSANLELAVELAWGLIANVSGGDWSKQSPEWHAAAIRWRDEYWSPAEARLAGRAIHGDPHPLHETIVRNVHRPATP